MMISTRGRYALHVMIDLAEHPAEGYIPLKVIANRQGISKEYVNNILKVLVENKMLISLRGKGGGYKLTNEPKDYTIGMILRLVEGNLAPVPCVSGKDACPRPEECPSFPMWKKLDGMINDFFDSITLADLMAENKDKWKEEP